MVVTYHLFSINTNLRRVYPGAVSYSSRSGAIATDGRREARRWNSLWRLGLARRKPGRPSDRVCGAVRLLRRLADVDVSSAAKAETDFTAVQRAGAKCPVRCADVELVEAEIIAILAEINS